jgi:hypothetical protein
MILLFVSLPRINQAKQNEVFRIRKKNKKRLGVMKPVLWADIHYGTVQ